MRVRGAGGRSVAGDAAGRGEEEVGEEARSAAWGVGGFGGCVDEGGGGVEFVG